MTSPTLQTLDVSGLRMQVAMQGRGRWYCNATVSLNFESHGGLSLPP